MAATPYFEAMIGAHQISSRAKPKNLPLLNNER